MLHGPPILARVSARLGNSGPAQPARADPREAAKQLATPRPRLAAAPIDRAPRARAPAPVAIAIAGELRALLFPGPCPCPCFQIRNEPIFAAHSGSGVVPMFPTLFPLLGTAFPNDINGLRGLFPCSQRFGRASCARVRVKTHAHAHVWGLSHSLGNMGTSLVSI
jgi:hypothetical protein